MNVKSILKTRNPSKQEIAEFLEKVQSGTEPCASFVAQASTAKVFKVCSLHKDKCTTDCVALKIPMAGTGLPFDTRSAQIQKAIQDAVQNTPAAAHFNRVLQVLPSPNGPVLVLEFEERKLTFHSLADVLQNVQMSEVLWRSINFQLLSTLYIAQQQIPGFTHNDTHTENILVVPNTNNHVCSVVTPAGRTLSHVATMLIKIIDFGQVLALDPKLQSRDGKLIWKRALWRNQMVDFQRFATWVVFDFSQFEFKEKQFPSWFEPWLAFVLKYLDPGFFVLKGNAVAGQRLDGRLIDFRKGRGMAPNEQGAEWLQANYGPESPFGLGSMLDDPYFDQFVVPELRFSMQIKPRLL